MKYLKDICFLFKKATKIIIKAKRHRLEQIFKKTNFNFYNPFIFVLKPQPNKWLYFF